MALIVDEICHDLREMGSPSDELIDWRQRYEGVLMVAYLDGKAVAGISGPWPVNQYALTWWDRPMPARQLELFDSLAAAQRRVEEWALRMRTIGVIDRPPANDPILPEATVSIAPMQRPSWFGKLREAITPAPRRVARESLEALRHQPLREDDLRDVHFAAVE
ncbi:MAG TPA: hypothetical protein VGO25_07915 [Rhodanobacteraceae bacterium]|jgi:hypothetical protein|nr:hypothetical protein [Rhodanobacteraceae bacterium]